MTKLEILLMRDETVEKVAQENCPETSCKGESCLDCIVAQRIMKERVQEILEENGFQIISIV